MAEALRSDDAVENLGHIDQNECEVGRAGRAHLHGAGLGPTAPSLHAGNNLSCGGAGPHSMTGTWS